MANGWPQAKPTHALGSLLSSNARRDAHRICSRAWEIAARLSGPPLEPPIGALSSLAFADHHR